MLVIRVVVAMNVNGCRIMNKTFNIDCAASSLMEH